MLDCQLPSVNVGHVCSQWVSTCLDQLEGQFDIGAQELCGAATDYTQTMEQKDLKMSVVLHKAFSPTIFHAVKKTGRWLSR